MSKIVIVDMNSGNLHSVAKALQSVSEHQEVIVSDNLVEIESASKLVVPGQGAINTWMKYFTQLNENDRLLNAIKNKPVFGICVGMQAMFETAEEGAEKGSAIKGLGLFQGHVKRFEIDKNLTIPQMGWNQVMQQNAGVDHPLWSDIVDKSWFYFAHSYHVSDDDQSCSLGVTEYDTTYTSAVVKDNIMAVQFHPEKSQNNGLALIKNFVNWKI